LQHNRVITKPEIVMNDPRIFLAGTLARGKTPNGAAPTTPPCGVPAVRYSFTAPVSAET